MHGKPGGGDGNGRGVARREGASLTTIRTVRSLTGSPSPAAWTRPYRAAIRTISVVPNVALGMRKAWAGAKHAGHISATAADSRAPTLQTPERMHAVPQCAAAFSTPKHTIGYDRPSRLRDGHPRSPACQLLRRRGFQLRRPLCPAGGKASPEAQHSSAAMAAGVPIAGGLESAHGGPARTRRQLPTHADGAAPKTGSPAGAPHDTPPSRPKAHRSLRSACATRRGTSRCARCARPPKAHRARAAKTSRPCARFCGGLTTWM